MNTEENELVVNNMGLAYDLALKYYNKIQYAIELDELQSVAFLGLVKASNTFNKELQYAFSTYAYNCIRNELVKFISDNIHNQMQSIFIEVADKIELQDIIPSNVDIENEFIMQQLKIKLLEYIDMLPDICRSTLIYKLGGYTFNEIAKKLSISLSQANLYYHRAINILRYRLKDWRSDK